jgi:CheY-like chemotaxis protein
MVFGAVAQNEGKISVRSQPGKGARFDVSFPSVATTAVVSSNPVTQTPRGGKETILVVEDEPALRALAVRVLTELGYQVLACEGGPAALELASDASIHIDLLFTDMIMPGMSGRDLAARLVDERRSLKVLFTSGFTSEVLQADDAGDVAFLRKPYIPSDLARRVRSVLDR